MCVMVVTTEAEPLVRRSPGHSRMTFAQGVGIARFMGDMTDPLQTVGDIAVPGYQAERGREGDNTAV